MQIILLVFGEDFPIIYSKMQQVTWVLNKQLLMSGRGVNC